MIWPLGSPAKSSQRSVDGKAVALAARELAQLQRELERVREVLTGLQQTLAQVEPGPDTIRASQLREANEHLIQAAVLAQGDADAAKHALEVAARSAELDVLTGLPNRRVLLDRVAQGIAMAKRGGRLLAVVFVDLDDFKQVNDALGHATGDEALKVVAQRLSSSIRDVDTVSRHGGDEFLILLSDLSGRADAAVVTDKMVVALAAPMQLGEHVVRMSASIGVSVYPDHGSQGDTLIHQADVAMYRAKRQGTGGIAFYDDEVADASAHGVAAPTLRKDA